jgi:hypothetical protein
MAARSQGITISGRSYEGRLEGKTGVLAITWRRIDSQEKTRIVDAAVASPRVI